MHRRGQAAPQRVVEVGEHVGDQIGLRLTLFAQVRVLSRRVHELLPGHGHEEWAGEQTEDDHHRQQCPPTPLCPFAALGQPGVEQPQAAQYPAQRQQVPAGEAGAGKEQPGQETIQHSPTAYCPYQEQQREGNPLHAEQVEVIALGKVVGVKGIDQAGDKGRPPVADHLAGQQIGPPSRQRPTPPDSKIVSRHVADDGAQRPPDKGVQPGETEKVKASPLGIKDHRGVVGRLAQAQRAGDPPVAPLEDVHVKAVTGQGHAETTHQRPEVSQRQEHVGQQGQEVQPAVASLLRHGDTLTFPISTALISAPGTSAITGNRSRLGQR